MNIYVAYSCAVSYVFANHYAVITKGLAFSGEISERYVFYGADFRTLKRKSQLGTVTTFAPYFLLFLSIPHIDVP